VSRVEGKVRGFACLFLIAATSIGHAEEDDPDFKPFPKLSVGFGIQGHGTRLAGRSEGGVGPVLELAHGRDRWQYLVEGSIASTGYDNGSAPEDASAEDMRIAGHMWRGALGVRWLARQLMLDQAGGVELVLHSLVGLQRLKYDERALTRPELAFGAAFQGRGYRTVRFTFRLDARVLYTPSDRESTLVVCGGRCMSGTTGSSTGFMMGMTFGW
jgi:hypothetical protein